eukprot:gb/GEZN01013632.1/.p1 GENE.gb/GEZN01013632.1/~~gb/GEZN01013632.1/.p1  ORF type:complete len:293 (-),score=22.16 gb/GEZN01013632.1/:124-906(-)
MVILPVYIACKAIFFIPFIAVKSKQRLAIPVILFGFKLIYKLCPWIHLPKGIDFSAMRIQERGCLVLMNHVSLMDPLVTCAIIPPLLGHNMRILVQSGLLEIPIFGSIIKMAGHFPVYFQNRSSEGAFQTDKEKMEAVKKDIDQFLVDGGTLCLYPEGQVNRKNPRELQEFRYGTFDIARKHNLPIYAYVAINAEHCWPSKAFFCGFPTNMRGRWCKLFDPLPSSMDSHALATHCKLIMQKELDILFAEETAAAAEKKKT